MRTRTSILLTASLAILLLAGGCKKSHFEGREIRFRASSKAPVTKTAYDGTVTTSEGKKHERINWVAGDMIAIMMEVEGEETPQFGEYRVSNVTAYSDEVSRCDLNPVGGPFGGNALKWGQGEHSFTAVYPSPTVSSSTEDPRWLNQFNEDHIIFCWPSVQTPAPKGDSGADALTLLPDMKYAYMFATAEEIQTPTSRSEKFNLEFSPLFTAFEIHVSAGDNDEVNLSGFRLIAGEDEILACKARDFMALEWDEMAGGLSNDGFTEATNEISVQWNNKIKLTRDGAPLVFTVFAFAPFPYIDYLPGEDDEEASFHQLTIEFTGDEILTRTLDLKQNGEWIPFKSGCKHRILGLNFPALDEGGASGHGINWNGALGEDFNWNSANGEDASWGRPDYVLPGTFSVSPTKAVHFSRGNLVYKAGKWAFHPYQYSRCLKTNSTVLDYSRTGTFDLFGWATAGIAAADATMKNFQPWSLNSTEISGQTSTNPYGYGPSIDSVPAETDWDVYADYCEWGRNYNLRQDLGTGWYTLSASEYNYMFCDRPASTVNDVPNARFARAVVHGTPGVLVFSDDFGTRYPQSNQSIFVVDNINDTSASGTPFEDIDIPDTAWTVMEEAGAVFFPATGIYIADRQHWLNDVDSGYDGYVGALWSRTSAPGQGEARAWLFSGREIEFGEGGVSRYYGLAVRLVKNAE